MLLLLLLLFDILHCSVAVTDTVLFFFVDTNCYLLLMILVIVIVDIDGRWHCWWLLLFQLLSCYIIVVVHCSDVSHYCYCWPRYLFGNCCYWLLIFRHSIVVVIIVVLMTDDIDRLVTVLLVKSDCYCYCYSWVHCCCYFHFHRTGTLIFVIVGLLCNIDRAKCCVRLRCALHYTLLPQLVFPLMTPSIVSMVFGTI